MSYVTRAGLIFTILFLYLDLSVHATFRKPKTKQMRPRVKRTPLPFAPFGPRPIPGPGIYGLPLPPLGGPGPGGPMGPPFGPVPFTGPPPFGFEPGPSEFPPPFLGPEVFDRRPVRGPIQSLPISGPLSTLPSTRSRPRVREEGPARPPVIVETPDGTQTVFIRPRGTRPVRAVSPGPPAIMATTVRGPRPPAGSQGSSIPIIRVPSTPVTSATSRGNINPLPICPAGAVLSCRPRPLGVATTSAHQCHADCPGRTCLVSCICTCETERTPRVFLARIVGLNRPSGGGGGARPVPAGGIELGGRIPEIGGISVVPGITGPSIGNIDFNIPEPPSPDISLEPPVMGVPVPVIETAASLPQLGVSDSILGNVPEPEINFISALDSTFGRNDAPGGGLPSFGPGEVVALEAPTAKIEVGLKAANPSLEVNAGPSIDVNLGEPKLPEFNVAVPAIDVSLGEPKLPEINVAGPSLDVSLGEPKLPEINVAGPSLDVSLGEPKLPEINVAGPSLDVSLGEPKLPEINVAGPSLDVSLGEPNLPEIKLIGPKIDLNVGDPTFPELNLPAPAINDIEIQPLINAELAGGLPNLDGPKLPDLSLSSSPVSTAVDLGLSGPDMKLSGPDTSTGSSLGSTTASSGVDLGFPGPDAVPGPLPDPALTPSVDLGIPSLDPGFDPLSGSAMSSGVDLGLSGLDPSIDFVNVATEPRILGNSAGVSSSEIIASSLLDDGSRIGSDLTPFALSLPSPGPAPAPPLTVIDNVGISPNLPSSVKVEVKTDSSNSDEGSKTLTINPGRSTGSLGNSLKLLSNSNKKDLVKDFNSLNSLLMAMGGQQLVSDTSGIDTATRAILSEIAGSASAPLARLDLLVKDIGNKGLFIDRPVTSTSNSSFDAGVGLFNTNLTDSHRSLDAVLAAMAAKDKDILSAAMVGQGGDQGLMGLGSENANLAMLAAAMGITGGKSSPFLDLLGSSSLDKLGLGGNTHNTSAMLPSTASSPSGNGALTSANVKLRSMPGTKFFGSTSQNLGSNQRSDSITPHLNNSKPNMVQRGLMTPSKGTVTAQKSKIGKQSGSKITQDPASSTKLGSKITLAPSSNNKSGSKIILDPSSSTLPGSKSLLNPTRDIQTNTNIVSNPVSGTKTVDGLQMTRNEPVRNKSFADSVHGGATTKECLAKGLEIWCDPVGVWDNTPGVTKWCLLNCRDKNNCDRKRCACTCIEEKLFRIKFEKLPIKSP